MNIWNEQNVRKDVWQKEKPKQLQRDVHLLLDGGAEGRCLKEIRLVSFSIGLINMMF